MEQPFEYAWGIAKKRWLGHNRVSKFVRKRKRFVQCRPASAMSRGAYAINVRNIQSEN